MQMSDADVEWLIVGGSRCGACFENVTFIQMQSPVEDDAFGDPSGWRVTPMPERACKWSIRSTVLTRTGLEGSN